MPEYQFGFRDNPAVAGVRHPNLEGRRFKDGYSVMSLFCGCGGMDLGFLGGFRYLGDEYRALPFNILSAIDIDERSIQTYRLNISDHGTVGDLTQIGASELPKARVLIGGFPCQDFSSSGPKLGFAGDRGQLYEVLVRYMAHHKPEMVIGENVPHLASLHGGQYLKAIVEDFEGAGYNFAVWNLFAPDYGLSQSRRRLFLVGVRKDLGMPPGPPKPTHSSRHRPIEEAIGDLLPITDETVANQSQYFVATKATAGGGQGDHTNKRGELAYCIRANAKARIQFHYELERRLTVRECARLQSFPDEFVFPFSAMNAMLQIGNAVPCILAHRVGLTVADHLARLDRGERLSQRPVAATLEAARVRPRRISKSESRQVELFSL
jgi:DNA (cytosine-5)-methyltransferase 1